MDIQEIFSLEFGKLPYTEKWTSNNDAEALLYVAASVHCDNSSGVVGLNVKVDGQLVATPSVFCNEIGISRPLVSEVVRIPAGRGEHSVTLEAMNDRTHVRARDYACGTVFYCGFVEPFVWRFKGPLPQSTTFKSKVNGIPGVLFFSGSGFVNPVKVHGIAVQLDGVEVARSQMKASRGNSHMAIPPQFLPVNLKAKEYKLSVVPIGDTIADQNDSFEVAIFY
ncbi:MAG TPA: hypothetical protein VII75_00745 [Thermoanaerobaculia bacterium]|nr:hypothetical protein [Thermoanaerobaculia bacterium]